MLAWQHVRPQAAVTPHSAADVMRSALRRSGAHAFFAEAAAAKEHILLLVNDGHRGTQTRTALTALAESAAGHPGLRFQALVATGTHQFPQQEQAEFQQATFGDCGLRIDEVRWHDCTNAPDLRPLAGVGLHYHLASHRFLLPIGSIEPHYFAGLTGAHKTVTIGCMALADIERNHRGALEPQSDILQLRGNPVYDGVATVVRGLQQAGKRILAINQVTEGANLLAASVGDPLDTLDELAPLVRDVFVQSIPRAVDILHLRVPPPLGRNLYQADKALKNNHLAVRDRGGILLEADCPEGIGPDAFMGLLWRADSFAEARRLVLEQGYKLGDHKAVKLRHLTDPAQRGVKIALVTENVTPEDALVAGMRSFPHVHTALAWLQDVVGSPCDTGLVVDDAGNVSVRAAQ